MATIHVDDDRITIQLTTLEKVGGMLRDQTVPLSAVTAVVAVDDALRQPSGVRAPGFAIPRRSKIGTWRGSGRRQLVCVRAGQPAVRIEASDQPYAEYIVGADDAEALAETIRSRF